MDAAVVYIPIEQGNPSDNVAVAVVSTLIFLAILGVILWRTR